jgi:hypothetical protein
MKMPNWCVNKLTVEGKPNLVRVFKQMVKGDDTDLSLDKMHPMPKALKNTISPDDNPNWYDWRNNNWGTKWDVEATLIFEEQGRLEYAFLSANSPPTEWLEKVAKDYLGLDFCLNYEEENVGFMGITKATKGKVKDKCLNIS